MTKPTQDFVEQLTAASIEAREVLAELRAELREARHVIKDMQAERARALEQIADEFIREKMEPKMEHIAAELGRQQRRLEATVDKNFKRYTNVCLYGNEQGRGPSIFDQIHARLHEELDNMGGPVGRELRRGS